MRGVLWGRCLFWRVWLKGTGIGMGKVFLVSGIKMGAGRGGVFVVRILSQLSAKKCICRCSM